MEEDCGRLDVDNTIIRCFCCVDCNWCRILRWLLGGGVRIVMWGWWRIDILLLLRKWLLLLRKWLYCNNVAIIMVFVGLFNANTVFMGLVSYICVM